eukprot:110408_1
MISEDVVGVIIKALNYAMLLGLIGIAMFWQSLCSFYAKRQRKGGTEPSSESKPVEMSPDRDRFTNGYRYPDTFDASDSAQKVKVPATSTNPTTIPTASNAPVSLRTNTISSSDAPVRAGRNNFKICQFFGRLSCPMVITANIATFSRTAFVRTVILWS